MKADEEANTGVQMAYVDETPSQLPPYSVLTIDKWTPKLMLRLSERNHSGTL